MKYPGCCGLLALAFSFTVHAQSDSASNLQAQQPLGGATFQNWTGLKSAGDGAAELDLPDIQAVYTVPDGPKGAHQIGLSWSNDSVIDAQKWYGFRFDVQLVRDDVPFTADFTIVIPPEGERPMLPASTAAHVQVQGKGWHTVTVPFASFDYNLGQVAILKSLKQLTLKGHYEGGTGQDKVLVRNFRLVRGNILHLDAGLRSAPGDAHGSVSYPVTITNCTDALQLVALSIQRKGWEGMPAEVTPSTLSLPPGQSVTATVHVTVPEELPPGAQETQTLLAIPQGAGASPETIQFITLRQLPHPYLVLTQQGWDDVRAKVEKYDWARTDADEIIKKADDWNVPAVLTGDAAKSTGGTPALFAMYEPERNVWNCAQAWKLTGDKKYAEKVAQFLRELADPATGFPVTLHATKGDIPQEGGFFENSVRAYDVIQDAGVLTDADKQNIEQTFRIYTRLIIDGLGGGGISNWAVFNLCPAAECALAVQDMASFNELMDGPCGVVDQLRYGMMDDGWWYEMSLAYNLGCAEAFTNLGIAAQPFGIDFLHAQYPAALTKKVGLRLFEFQNFEGMAFGKFGPMKDNTVTLKKMWDGITIYPDYRGVMFGMGDGHEELLSGGRFEEAYFAFRDPAYAAILKEGNKRDLLFGVPELPQDTPKLYTLSGHSDNAGIAVLRSQTTGREPREQIQAAFKYGAHGSYHGHFDRISFVSLMRYGRSFYNPETSWFGYGSYMYKMWVQTSLSHNMVVVDAKMQEPKECVPLLFHSGPMLQAVAAETTARWSNPPYFGGYADQLEKVKAMNPPPVVIPDNHPKPGEVTEYTEPVRQRRLVLVTDDYVVLADDLQAEQEHTFDNLLHLRGAALADSSTAQLEGHDGPFNASPLGSGQFITNCDRYSITAPLLIHSADMMGAKNDTKSEPGVLQIDEHVLWPQSAELVLGDYPSAAKKKPGSGEEPIRKTISVRSKGKTARFLTLIEPYEDKALVKSARAASPDQLRVELTDGRVQEIQITDLADDGKNLTVTITESKDGKTTRTETAIAGNKE